MNEITDTDRMNFLIEKLLVSKEEVVYSRLSRVRSVRHEYHVLEGKGRLTLDSHQGDIRGFIDKKILEIRAKKECTCQVDLL